MFTDFATAAPTFDVAVDADGIVWFTQTDGQIGRLDPASGNPATAIDVPGDPPELNVASDGAVLFTERFVPQAVGRVDPATDAVTLFPADGGPEDIAAAADGSMWFTRSDGDNIEQITPAV